MNNITSEQKEIIRHAMKNGYFCGGSPEMDQLCQAGLMEYAGRKSFVPDPYYRATEAGRAYVAKMDREKAAKAIPRQLTR